MTNHANPWDGMTALSQRRVDVLSDHDIFWITDAEGKFGLYLKSTGAFYATGNVEELSGLTVERKRTDDGFGELILVLANSRDWQIFHVLCEDLITVTHLYKTSLEMINAVECRLRRWRQILKKNLVLGMPIEKQMGLFGELKCLQDIIAPKVGIAQAIASWNGPDPDRQDFLLDQAVLEIKTHRTSKGEIVTISSAHQLHSVKPIYLLSYSLSFSENGETVQTVASDIIRIIGFERPETAAVFESKLTDYGYVPELIKEPLQHFKTDNMCAYWVDSQFPKITADLIPAEIINVKPDSVRYC